VDVATVDEAAAGDRLVLRSTTGSLRIGEGCSRDADRASFHLVTFGAPTDPPHHDRMTVPDLPTQ
jgi:hypothetical protein